MQTHRPSSYTKKRTSSTTMSTNESSTYTPDIPSEPVTKTTDTVHIELTPNDLDSLAATRFVRSPSAGATVLFIGTTRDSFNNMPVSSLSYTSYTPLAMSTLYKIATGTFYLHKFPPCPLHSKPASAKLDMQSYPPKTLLHQNRHHPQTRRMPD